MHFIGKTPRIGVRLIWVCGLVISAGNCHRGKLARVIWGDPGPILIQIQMMVFDHFFELALWC
jgi:hypothetical protein